MSSTEPNNNFEINLLPVISLLAVLISFLLLTTVWVHVGTLDVKQALGQQVQSEELKSVNSLWITWHGSGDVEVEVKNKDKRKIKSFRLRVDNNHRKFFAQLMNVAKKFQGDVAHVEMGFVSPSKRTPYKNVIRSVEILKSLDFKNVGVTPVL